MLGNTIPNEVVFFARYRIAKISHDANLSRNGNAKEMRKKCERNAKEVILFYGRHSIMPKFS
jgi:hypothetical protein